VNPVKVELSKPEMISIRWKG